MADAADENLDPGNDPSAEQLQEEQDAKNIGWAPKDVYKGDPDKWVDAHTFLERGQHVMPILRKNNEKLQRDIGTVREENARLREMFKASQDSIKALEEFHTAETVRQVEAARKSVIAQLKVAKKEGDIEGEVDLAAELTRLDTAAATAASEEKARKARPNGDDRQPPARQEMHPDFKPWADENPWFGKDPMKTHLALGIAERMRLDGDTRAGRPFMDDVTAELAKIESAMAGRPANKVEGARGGGLPRQTNGKRFSDLPADAQAACHSYTKRLVGSGRAYKTEAEWEAAYTKKYLEGE